MSTRRTLTTALLIAALVPSVACTTTDQNTSGRTDLAAAAKARPTAAFAGHHAEVRQHLDTIDLMLAQVRVAGPTTQREHMSDVVTFLNRHLRPHIVGEEDTLYDLADEKANRGGGSFTASLRYEHVIMHRWIDEMQAEAASPQRDVREFARLGEHLSGLIRAHLETEEEVVLRMLDDTTTASEFDRRVTSR